MFKISNLSAATVAIAALVSAVPALADHNGGGPLKQNGQCWKASRMSDQMFGIWGPCSEKAAGRPSGGRAQTPTATPTATPTQPGGTGRSIY